jgi:hypothetical protein
MAILGRCAIPVTEETRTLLKSKGAIPNVRSYSSVITDAFELIDKLKIENDELRERTKQLDNMHDAVTKIATSLI